MPSFTCHWLNRHDQFGKTNITLTVTDNDGVIPQQRIEKNFPTLPDPPQDAQFLEDRAMEEVETIVDEWNAAQEVVE